MTAESTLTALLKTLCPRVYPDIAPSNVAKPYITWQNIGGESARLLDNTPFDKRNTLMQINVWSASRIEALSMIRQIEEALCASSSFIARPQGESNSTYEPDTLLYGSLQRFNVWATR